MLSYFEMVKCTSVDAEHEYNPPNAVTSLTHLKVLLNLISQLTKIQQECIKLTSTGCLSTGELVCEEEEEEEVIGADAHFHLDMLVKQSEQNLKDIVTRNKVKINPMVTCLAFPSTWQWMESNKVPDTAKNVITEWHPT